ncbi:MAG: hypothetical protein L3J93_00810 [Thermoplasmata archaeon]|nr:hypothetical protein [Thermoplasmata archaeon]
MAVHRTPPVDERGLYGEFPFLPGAEALIDELAPSIGGLFRETALDPARAAGRARVRSALENPSGGLRVPELAALAGDERFLSFQFARLVLSASPTRAPIRRWAVAEAKAAGDRLHAVQDHLLGEVAHRLGHDITLEGEEVLIPLPTYLRLATPIREGEFRLSRQALRRGEVRLDRGRAIRLLEEGVRITLTNPVELDEGVRATIEEREGEFLREIAQRVPAPPARAGPGLGALRPVSFPPCIRLMRRTLENGENLSHSGRFALAAFLHRAGADFDGIVDAYRGAPDFDESITRYQVDHITKKEEGRGYEPPDCATLRSHGLCARDGDVTARDPMDRRRDPLCFEAWLKNPMQYYRTVSPPGTPAARSSEPRAGPSEPREGAIGTPGERGPRPSTGPR